MEGWYTACNTSSILRAGMLLSKGIVFRLWSVSSTVYISEESDGSWF